MFDTALNLYMQSVENPLFTQISKFMDLTFDPLILIFLSLIISFYLFCKGSKKEGIVFSTSMIIMAILLQSLKEIFKRARPLNSLIIQEGYSLPSGHSMASIVFFGLIAYFISRKKSFNIKILSCVIFGILTLLTGLSRIYLRVHWTTDVLAGFLIGGIILAIAIIAIRREN
ncbi:MAG: phosphatase PAP2 family protein [Candidatus Pacearchaeota archaeon]